MTLESTHVTLVPTCSLTRTSRMHTLHSGATRNDGRTMLKRVVSPGGRHTSYYDSGKSRIRTRRGMHFTSPPCSRLKTTYWYSHPRHDGCVRSRLGMRLGNPTESGFVPRLRQGCQDPMDIMGTMRCDARSWARILATLSIFLSRPPPLSNYLQVWR